ncbi:MAG: hypothetical protein CBB67_006560 [Alteromonadaceae bacterium TMED7]|nr:MAG: hypothetical protein CBB67_006560 [Alteromonadaceae bacterium TMED7]
MDTFTSKSSTHHHNESDSASALHAMPGARSEKPSLFCKGFNDGASTRDRTRDTRIFNPSIKYN